ncbi:hypothetical protein H0H87_002668 [Tephrocybe sp. NHM501043]|nr:hypothetical protein H0H87_002668 [Tephrocybe sp. NHM501043]
MTDTGEVTKPGRTLIVCFDGTSNEYDGDNTNIVKLVALLKKDDFNQQLVYYQPGIGTWFNPGVVSPFFRWGAKILDEAFAWYLDEHVIEGYKFLMQNYRVGDKICIFGATALSIMITSRSHILLASGFSRGSYTARALAGVLHKVGLLPRDNEQQIPFAYKLYKRTDKVGLGLCAGFKQTFCQDIKVEFVGVWDTVASVGVLAGRTLPFTNSNKAIKTFRHALSLDEHRAKFRPNLFHRPAPTKAVTRLDPGHVTQEVGQEVGGRNRESTRGLLKSCRYRGGIKRFFRKLPMLFLDPEPEDDGTPDTDVLEVWFSGCHADVGGGSVQDSEPHSLANISLRWMVRQVQKAHCGIMFDAQAMERAGIPLMVFADIDTLVVKSPDVELPPTSPINEIEEEEDAQDALEPINDQLKANPMWWVLENIPLTYSWQDPECVWHRKLRCVCLVWVVLLVGTNIDYEGVGVVWGLASISDEDGKSKTGTRFSMRR